MKRVEFKRRDGKPLYAWLELCAAWTESTETRKDGTYYAQVTVGGQKWIVDEPLEQVDRKLRGIG